MLTEEQKSHLDERGYLLLENLISADEADEMRTRSLELAREDLDQGRDYRYLDGAQRVWNLVDKGEVFERAIQHPRLVEAMEYLLGEDFTLSSFTANIIGVCRKSRV